MHSQTLWGRRASLLFWSGFTHKVGLSPWLILTVWKTTKNQTWSFRAALYFTRGSHALLADSCCVVFVCPCRSCMMQADSEKLRQAWIKAVQNSIATAFRDKGENSEVKPKLTGVGVMNRCGSRQNVILYSVTVHWGSSKSSQMELWFFFFLCISSHQCFFHNTQVSFNPVV